ncbi:hypothetical protein SASPL_142416 [Salvia splendens]|uniref:Uncharacterized protein n=1 Tax=Salvia splendens TaxID=180675 RepID=A0A8X8Z9S7_SALSN|nr:hypothetical protein SASPL_142416 [Salvia splendens]
MPCSINVLFSGIIWLVMKKLRLSSPLPLTPLPKYICILYTVDNGEDVDGLPTEGVEIACFHLDGSHYMIYTPSDPLLFVAVKVKYLVLATEVCTDDKDGVLQIADDELLDDPAIISAIDEETEFNALVEEEAALLDSLLGKR